MINTNMYVYIYIYVYTYVLGNQWIYPLLSSNMAGNGKSSHWMEGDSWTILELIVECFITMFDRYENHGTDCYIWLRWLLCFITLITMFDFCCEEHTEMAHWPRDQEFQDFISFSTIRSNLEVKHSDHFWSISVKMKTTRRRVLLNSPHSPIDFNRFEPPIVHQLTIHSQ